MALRLTEKTLFFIAENLRVYRETIPKHLRRMK